jgi:hypothetical protein
MLLGFIVSERGIEANPEKIATVTNMGPIKDLKGVQRVMGCLAALSRFISRLGERGLPLYRLLRKTERFTWTPEAEEALGNLKALLTSVPILVPPAAGEALLIYVAATTQVVGAAIVVERREEGHALLVQRPVYFISEVLSETKIRYPQIQKLLYVVILTRRKLRHYFESHTVTVRGNSVRLLGGKGKAGSGHTKKEPGHRYPQILTRSEPKPIVPAGRTLGPRAPLAPPRFAPLPASAPLPLWAPEAPKGRPAHATSRRPEDQPPVRPARAAALRGQAGQPDPPGSPQLPRPRGKVPPQPAPALRTETPMSRPQIPTAPARSGAGSTTPGLASDPG